MRSSKSRSRSKQNRPRSIGNIVNRVFDSSGPEGKVRGTPQQIIEKYQALARDAQLSNDRVAAENFLQHAEHYTRMLGEAMRELAAEQDTRRQNSAPNGNGHQERNQSYARREERVEEEQPEVGAVPVFAFDGDDSGSGLVETPEARTEQSHQPERSDSREGRGEYQRSERSDQPRRDRGEFQRGERQDRGERNDQRNDRQDRAERGEPRAERGEPRAERGEPRAERGEPRAERGEPRAERNEPRAERAERNEPRAERADRGDQPREDRRPARGPRATLRAPRSEASVEAPVASAPAAPAAVIEAAPAAPAAAEPAAPKVRRPRAPRKSATGEAATPPDHEAAE